MQENPAMTQAFLVANLARMNDIHSRIKELREKAGLSMEQLAEALGVSWQTVQQWENGKTAPQRKRLQAVAEILKTTEEYLATGFSESRIKALLSARVQKKPETRHIPDLDTHHSAVAIRKVIFKISAGIAGFAVEFLDNGDGDPIYLASSWFEKRGIDPAKVYAARVGGKSMDPNYKNKSIVLVNTGDTRRQKDAVYAVNHDGEFAVKRLRSNLRRWYLFSDNPNQAEFPPVECGDSTYILGRIILNISEAM